MSKKTLTSLHQLYAKHTGKVSDKWSLYLAEYDRLFAEYRNKPIRLLEIGIQNGGSLDIWSKYFSNATALIGCDINPACILLSYDDPRIQVVIGDANAPDVHEVVLKHSPQFDIIIDDGSHLSSDIVKSFALYFPRLVEGGIFIAEDLHCSYWSRFEGGLYDPYSSISFFKRLADVINHEHWGIARERAEILRGIFTKYGCEVDADMLSQVHSVEFINSMCVVRKASADLNGLGRRVITGSLELVVPDHSELHDCPYQLDPIFDQSSNPWTARTSPPDEAIEETERRLINAEQQIANLNQNLVERDGQIANLNQILVERDGQITILNQESTNRDKQITLLGQKITDLHNSTSWRMTAPLRHVVTRTKNFAKGLTSSVNTTISGNNPAVTQLANRGLRGLAVQRGLGFYRRYMKGTQLGDLMRQRILERGLVSSSELQFSALSHNSTVSREELPVDENQINFDSDVRGYHYSQPLHLEVSNRLALRPHINVILPSLRLKHMSGGPNTALLFAALLAEKGEWVRLIACDASAEGEETALFPHMDGLLQRPVARNRIELVDAFDRTKSTEIGANDLFFATAWWTAQIAKYAVKKTVHKTFIYLIQDFEPILHEGSTFQARALETYGLPHIPVINTRLLLDHLVKESAGCYADPEFVATALCFEPALDRSRYFPSSDKSMPPSKKILLFYARPKGARRNLYEMGVVALRQAVASGVIDKDSWEVWAMGEKLEPVPLGNGVFLNPLPWMNFDEYAKRVRTSDLLLSLMLSPHPSYPPLEMAASGNLVVTNSFSVKTAERMKAFSPNILVAEPTIESIASILENAVGRINAGLPSYDLSGGITLPSNWDESLGEIVPALLQRISSLLTAPLSADMPRAIGYPSIPKTHYEKYRRACLDRRRREGEYQQERGLLSFVTSAYNTDPVFLEELGSSVLFQDGGTEFEWLILDNGSTNEGTRITLQELARHPSVRLERVEDNLGIIGGMRFCLERARGRYILPLDSDDLIEPDCVNVLTRFIKENNYPPLLYTDEDKLNDGQFSSAYFKPDWDPILFLHSCYIAHLCVIDRELAIQLGLYSDKTAEGCHDWDSFIRFMNAGHVPIHVPEVLYSWRIHVGSTSGNISSKSYITESHRNTLQRFLDHSGVPNIELVYSPLFRHNVDWWFRRKRVDPKSMQTIIVGINDGIKGNTNLDSGKQLPLILNTGSGINELAALIKNVDSELIHICWQDAIPDDDEWQWEAMALLELFPDSVMVGGIIHDGIGIIDGPRVFGFGDGFDCPDSGREITRHGYMAQMSKPHTVSAVPTAHCVIEYGFLVQCLAELIEEDVPTEMLGLWLGAKALESGNRVVYSPFMRTRIGTNHEITISESAKENFMSRFWSQIPDSRMYSQRMGLDLAKAYLEVDPNENSQHLLHLQKHLLPYPKWFEKHLRGRAERYPLPENPVRITLITTVYEGTNMDFLDALAESVISQTVKVSQWIIVAHGPISTENVEHVVKHGKKIWSATVIREPKPLGIMGAMWQGLEKAKGEYIVPVDADDLLTPDAIQILTNAIARLNKPDMIFSDEDLFVEGQPCSPYLRSAFDPVLNLDSSYIWHICAINREKALKFELYTDTGATWCHDWDTVLRVANSGGRIEHVPEVLYHWRQHSGSTTNNVKGDSRSLDSVRYILQSQIALTTNPQHYYIAEWPQNRGMPELYIARCPDNLPQLVWIGDAVKENNFECDENALLVITSNGVLIESQQVFVEVARLLELHPNVGAVGGLVVGKDNMVVDSCFMVNEKGLLESPWLGKPLSHSGPYSLARKAQSVATTGNSLVFFRISALKQIGAWPLEACETSTDMVIRLCGILAENGWTFAFSPLVQAYTSSALPSEQSRWRLPSGISSLSHALVRYGMTLNHRN
jgi:O-antigen biosynthesis protein